MQIAVDQAGKLIQYCRLQYGRAHIEQQRVVALDQEIAVRPGVPSRRHRIGAGAAAQRKAVAQNVQLAIKQSRYRTL